MSVSAGIRSAVETAGGFLAIYALAGLILIPIVSTIAGPSELGDLTGYYVAAQLISALALWPSSAIMVLLLQELIGPARWGRLRVVGVLAVPIVWVGTLACAGFCEAHSDVLRSLVGSWSPIVIVLGLAITFSNLTLLLAWLIPQRRQAYSP